VVSRIDLEVQASQLHMECGLESSLTCLDSNLRVHCTCACPQREEKSSERAFWRMHPKWI